jgi:hypothetical protein
LRDFVNCDFLLFAVWDDHDGLLPVGGSGWVAVEDAEFHGGSNGAGLGGWVAEMAEI